MQTHQLNRVESKDPNSVTNLHIDSSDPVYPKEGNYYSKSNLMKFQNIDSVKNLEVEKY